jgi:HlyD family secretion protein
VKPHHPARKKRIIFLAFLLLLIGVGGLVYWGQYRRNTAERYYSGTIEANESNLAFQISGRVIEVPVDDGVKVEKDQLLARLNPDEFKARRDQALAELERARASQEQLESYYNLTKATIPSEIERARSAVKALDFQLHELEAGYRPQEKEQARLALEEARAGLDEARRNKDRFDRLFSQGIVAEREKDEKDLTFEVALKKFEQAKEAYDLLKEGYRRETVEALRARRDEAMAVLKQATSNMVKIDAAEKEVKAAKARVTAAQAALALSEIHLRQTELNAPFSGVVSSRNVEPGEVVTPGREVISIVDLSKVDLTIFVSETEIGRVKPGQDVEVKIDTFPDKVYKGRVSFIADEGEFTPKIIQTHKERVKLVYRVKIALSNPDYELKPGMPADAWLR